MTATTLTERQGRVLNVLNDGPLSTQEIEVRVGAAPRDSLMALKAKGLVERLEAGQGSPTRWRKA